MERNEESRKDQAKGCVCVCVGVCSCICYIMSTKTLVLLAKRGRLGEVRTFELVLTTLKAYLRFKARF